MYTSAMKMLLITVFQVANCIETLQMIQDLIHRDPCSDTAV